MRLHSPAGIETDTVLILPIAAHDIGIDHDVRRLVIAIPVVALPAPEMLQDRMQQQMYHHILQLAIHQAIQEARVKVDILLPVRPCRRIFFAQMKMHMHQKQSVEALLTQQFHTDHHDPADVLSFFLLR